MAAFNVRTAYSNDYQWFDGYETIDVAVKNPAGQTATDVKAVREPESDPEIRSGDFGSEHPGIVLYIWDSTLEGIHLKNGDQIGGSWNVVDRELNQVTDRNGNDIVFGRVPAWTILSLTQQLREPRWRAVCVKQVS